MKIGIITSGSESLTLFKFLAQHDHDYIVYYDFFHRPYGDKTFEQSLSCVEQGIAYLTKCGVDAIIVPPIYELALLEKKTKANILPLFKTYVLDFCFPHSLVGKIGLLGDFADIQQAQMLIKNLEQHYVLSDTQRKIKKFHSPFVYWTKETPLWKYYLTSLSYSNMLVNKLIKFDLRYFKDAMTDTILPFNYGYFHYQTTITKFLNFKKIRFHGLEQLEKIFDSFSLQPSKTYTITIAYTGHYEFLRREKRLMRLLQKGKHIEIQWQKI